ncbi:MAG: bifunctional DNA-formamidopyrimidine glycosylase/DNA-(apurinic or apyrimidinic site) lyase [Bryobacteraceae bacterium]
MPELPEVEAVCRRLRPAVTGRTIVEARISRCAAPSTRAAVEGRPIHGVDRAGKHILVRLDGGVTVHTHLRMSGNLFAIRDHRFASAAARVVFALDDGSAMVLEDPRALARMEARPSEAVDVEMAKLGPEPLSPAFTAAWFIEKAKESRQPAKLFLMDQARVAGLGNIYAAEALYAARVNPRKLMQRQSVPKLRALHEAIVNVLTLAVQSAIAAYSRPGEFAEAGEFPCAVYGREGEPCEACGRRILRIRQGGRSTYYCPGCQR